jgi:hypothetical protein
MTDSYGHSQTFTERNNNLLPQTASRGMLACIILAATLRKNRYMRNIIYILSLVLPILACGQTSIKLDSIDKTNNASIIASGDKITKAFISLKEGDSIISLTGNIRQAYRIFGYGKPDTKSERLLLLSIFTNDVEKNTFGCKLGAYYDTGGMTDIKLKYIGTSGDFVKALAIDKSNKSTTIYFEKKWIEFD